MTDPPFIDPYRRCEDLCTHDLGRGVLILELIEEDGPYVGAAFLTDGAAFVLAALRVREQTGLLGLDG